MDLCGETRTGSHGETRTSCQGETPDELCGASHREMHRTPGNQSASQPMPPFEKKRMTLEGPRLVPTHAASAGHIQDSSPGSLDKTGFFFLLAFFNFKRN